MDLTLGQFRQKLAAINRRRMLERRDRVNLTSWQTRTLAGFIAAGYLTDGKKENPAIKDAAAVAYDEIEQLMLKAAEKRAAERRERELVDRATQPGSYERLMGSLGNPAAWRP